MSHGWWNKHAENFQRRWKRVHCSLARDTRSCREKGKDMVCSAGQDAVVHAAGVQIHPARMWDVGGLVGARGKKSGVSTP